MPQRDLANMPPEQRLAVAHSNGDHERALAAFLALDRRLGQFVSQSREQILTQMRLAWWRDQLGKPVAERPAGDEVLEELSRFWRNEESALIALVDGWEALLAEPPLPDEAALEFVTGRSLCFAALARMADCPTVDAMHCGVMWAFGDLLAKVSNESERSAVIELAEVQCVNPVQLPYSLRSLLILGVIGKRTIARGYGPMMSGRRDIAMVMRLGLFGR